MNSIKKRKSFKEAAYGFISKSGIRVLQKIFPEYFAKEPLRPTDRYIEYPFVLRNLPRPPLKVLDVGSSGSFFPLLLASVGYDVYGIDIREYAIVNKIKFDNFQFVKEDITKTSFPDNYFDAITAISTIEHIGISGRHGSEEDPEADKKTIDEIRRILKPRGVILLTVPFGKAKVIKPYSRIYDGDLINKLLKGLKIENEEYYIQDKNDDWFECSKQEAGDVDAKSDRYPLCLLKMRKE